MTLTNSPPSASPHAEEEESSAQDAAEFGAPRFTMGTRVFASLTPLAMSNESMPDGDESATEMRPRTPVEDPPPLVQLSRPTAPNELGRPGFEDGHLRKLGA